MMRDEDFYAVLKVSRSADGAAIRAAYRALVKRYHPDVASGEAALIAFHRISEAYGTLSDPQRRAAYDLRLLQAERASVAEPVQRPVYPMYPTGPTTAQAPPAMAPGSPGNRNDRIGASLAIAATVVLLLAGQFMGKTSFSVPDTLMSLQASASALSAPASLFEKAAPETPTERATRDRQELAQAAWHKEIERQVRAQRLRESAEQDPKASQTIQQREVAQGPLETGIDATLPKASRLEVETRQSTCVGEDGMKFTIVNRSGAPSVAYDGNAPARASTQSAGKAFLLLTNFAPNDSMMISVMRGNGDATTILYADARGQVTRTVAARCEGLAF